MLAIARRLGVSPYTVKGRLQRGLAELREQFAADGTVDSNWRERVRGLVLAPATSTGWFASLGFLKVAGLIALLVGVGTLAKNELTPEVVDLEGPQALSLAPPESAPLAPLPATGLTHNEVQSSFGAVKDQRVPL